MLAYEGFPSDLRYHAKSNGHYLTATVYVPYCTPREQELPLQFGDGASVRFQMPQGRQISSNGEELTQLWLKAREMHEEILKRHDVEFRFSAWLSGNTFRPTPGKLIDTVGDRNEHGLMFAVHTLSIDPITAGIEIPGGIPWDEWITDLGNTKGFAVQRYVNERVAFLEPRLAGRKRELAPA